MPAHRKPSVLLERSGAFNQNPQRRRSTIAGRGELPRNPPSHLRQIKGAMGAWKEIVAVIPEGVPSGSDQFTVERCAVLLARSRTEKVFTASEEAQLRAYLGALGLMPEAREKLHGGSNKKPESPFAGVGAPVVPIRGR